MQGDVRTISDDELLRRAVTNARPRFGPRKNRTRVEAVMDVFGLGSTFAAQLIARFDLNPDELVNR